MALAHFQRTFTDTSGNIKAGISVEIRNESTGAMAAIFADKDGNTVKSNPFTTDSFGYGDFYAASGRYRIIATGIDWRNEDLVTFEALADAVNDAETAAQAAALNAGIYADTTAGLAATVDGEYFSVPSSDAENYLDLYLNDAGSATLIDSYPNRTRVDNLDASLSAEIDNRVIRVGSVAEIETLTPSDGWQASLSGTRAGVFKFDASDLSTEVAADTQQGVYIAPSSDATGASGAWVRQFGQNAMMFWCVLPEWFGAVSGDGNTYSTEIQAALDIAKSVDLRAGGFGVDEVIFLNEGNELKGSYAKLISYTQRVVSGNEVPFVGCLGFSNVSVHGIEFEMSSPSLTFSGYGIQHALANSQIYTIAGTTETTAETQAQNIEVYDCKFYGIGNYQFIFQGGLHEAVRYQNNFSEGCIRGVAAGFSERGSGNGLIFANNTFLFREIAGVQSSPLPIALKVDGFYQGVQCVKNNVFTTLSNSSTSGVPAIQFECGITDSQIEGNIINGSGTDGGIWLTIGQSDSSNTKQAPCERIHVTNNEIQSTGLGIFTEMPKDCIVSFNRVTTEGSAITLNVINTSVEPWATDPNAQFFRDNYASAPYPDDVDVIGNRVESTNVGNSSVTGINAKGRNLNISSNKVINGYTALKVNDPSIENVQENITVEGNFLNGAVYSAIAYGTITNFKFQNNVGQYGAQNGFYTPSSGDIDNFNIRNNQLNGTGTPINLLGDMNIGSVSGNTLISGSSDSINANHAGITNVQLANNIIDGVISIASSGANVVEVNTLTY